MMKFLILPTVAVAIQGDAPKIDLSGLEAKASSVKTGQEAKRPSINLGGVDLKKAETNDRSSVTVTKEDLENAKNTDEETSKKMEELAKRAEAMKNAIAAAKLKKTEGAATEKDGHGITQEMIDEEKKLSQEVTNAREEMAKKMMARQNKD